MRPAQIINIIRSCLAVWSVYGFMTIFAILLLPFYILNRNRVKDIYRYYGPQIGFSIFRFFGLKTDLENFDSIKQLQGLGSVLVISNHMDSVDALMLAPIRGQNTPVFFAKQSLKLVPYFEDFIFLSRDGMDRNFFNDVQKSFDKGRSVAIFPEGTRALKDKVIPFSKSVALIARRYNCKVVLYSLNSGLVFSKVGPFYSIDFHKVLKLKFVEYTTYEKAVFKVLFSEQDNKTTEMDNDLTYAELLHLLNLLSYQRFGPDSRNVYSDLSRTIEVASKMNYSLLKKKVGQVKQFISNSLPASFPELPGQTYAELCKANQVLQQMRKLSNSEKDTIFTTYVEQKIRENIS